MRLPASLALAAAAVASAFYLLPSSISIVAWTAGGPSRVALLAPLSRLWLALAVSALAFAGAGLAVRRHADARERLLRASLRLSVLLLWVVPFLPWLPDRAPLLLILAGPLRWAVLALAAGGAAAAIFPRAFAAPIRVNRAAVFAISLVVYLGAGLRFHAVAGFGGDEPHYLVIAHSLLVDRDLDIANNHERRDYRAFFAGELRPDYLQPGKRGEIYSIHAPGLPAVLLPAYAMAGATGAVATMAVLAALAALAMFDLAVLAGGAAAGTVTWAALCLTVPFIPHAWLIYPEGAGVVVVAWSALWIWRGGDRPPRLVAHGVLLALLPWLHTKFIVLTVLLAAWQCARVLPRAKALAVFLTPIAVSIAAWLLFFYHLYGTFDPQAPYGSSAQLNVLANVPHGTLGLLFDQKFGLLAFSPVYVLAGTGLALMARDPALRTFALGLGVAAAGFIVGTTRFYMWWAGSSAPARFLVPVLALFAPPIAVSIARMRGVLGRGVVVLTVVASLGIAAVCLTTDGGELFFSDPHGRSRLLFALQGSAPLDASLPTFTEENWYRPLGLLLLWLTVFGAGVAAAIAGVRSRVVRSAFGVATLMILTFGVGASLLVRSDAADREDTVSRGQLSVIQDYDAARLAAVSPNRRARLSPGELSAALTVVAPSLSERPWMLPEGEYEARVWFSGDRSPAGGLRVGISDRMIVGTAARPLANPSTIRFSLPVPAPVSVVATDAADAGRVRRVELAPLRLAAGVDRSYADVTKLEPVDGPAQGYMAYVGDTSYPEGGVFWTRGTDTARLLLVPAGAAQLLLTLHVGPYGGAVALDVDERHVDLEMGPNETRDVTFPLSPNAARVRLAIRAARSFRPADVDKASDDQRALGVQVRPRLVR